MEISINNLFKDINTELSEQKTPTGQHSLHSFCDTMFGIDSWIGFKDYCEEHQDLLE